MGKMWWIIGGALVAVCVIVLALVLPAPMLSSEISEADRQAFYRLHGYWPDW